MKADVNSLIGRSFTSSSGNIAVMELIEEGAFRAQWKRVPSLVDVHELNDWAQLILGPNTDITTVIGKQNEAAGLKEWKEKQ